MVNIMTRPSAHVNQQWGLKNQRVLSQLFIDGNSHVQAQPLAGFLVKQVADPGKHQQSNEI